MQPTQVKFKPIGEEAWQGGILFTKETDAAIEDAFVVCGCCGSIYEMDDIEELVVFSNWIDISQEIIGAPVES